MIPLPDDFRDFIRLLNRRRVRYVVVGGYAVAFHGFPRHTGDINLKNKRASARPKDLEDLRNLPQKVLRKGRSGTL